MEEIGNILREAREARGASLSEAQEQLKIQTKYLSAMEGGRFDELPTSVHARGYLKNYAKYLGLDPQPLLDEYQHNLMSGGRRGRPAEDGIVPPREGNPFFNPVNMQLNPTQNQNNGESLLRVIIILALIAAILLVASRFFFDGSNVTPQEGVDSFIGFLQGERPQSAADIDTEQIVESAEITPEQSIVETGRGVAEDETVPTRVPVLELPTDLEIINVTLETTRRVYIIATVDGEPLLADNVPGGETIELTAQQQLDLSVANAFAVILSVNGVEYGRMGEPNETRDVSLTVNQ